MRRIFYLILLLFLESCRNELPYENINFKEKPVIHAFYQTDSGITISTFKSMPVTGPILSSEIGIVELKLFNSFDAFLGNILKTSKGNYALPFNLKMDSVYTIKMKSDFGEMTFKCVMPPVTKITKIDTFTSANYNSTKYFNMNIHFFNDPSRILYFRYYVLEGYYKYVFGTGIKPIDSILIEDQLEINSNEKIVLSNSDNSYSNREILFSNQGLSAGNIFLKTGSSKLKRGNKETRQLWVVSVLETVDENLYKFYNERNAHIYHQNDLVSQPAAVKSNIPNGYGVYGSFGKSEYKIKF